MANDKGDIVDNTADNISILRKFPTRPSEKTNDKPPKVDINVLKSRIEKRRKKESKQTFVISFFFIICLGVLGIYFSL